MRRHSTSAEVCTAWIPLLSCLLFGTFSEAAAAAGVPISVLRTGSGTTLATSTQLVAGAANANLPQLEFSFGFASDEAAGPGTFFDSGTVTLSDQARSLTAIYLTVDVFGVARAPSSPGALMINPASVLLLPVGFPEVGSSHGFQTAYDVRAPVPVEMWDRPLAVYLDLFDNRNAESSLVWISSAIVVPEPGAVGLALLGATGWWLSRRLRR